MAGEARKRVTVLFSDVVESTVLGEQLDPEALRRAMGRFFELMRSVLESHGGSVEKFIGDAVMAVFGVPQLHEDDALRAIRAAVEVRERLGGLNAELASSYGIELQIRTGVNTGEVVVGEGEPLVTGDAVNVAARLEQAAGEGEILIGAATYALVRDAVEVEVVEGLALKGKSRPTTAYRLLAVHADRPGYERRLDSPLVGRERELRLLGTAFEQAVAGRACQLVTVLGQPGVGKTRLVDDFVAELGDVRVLRGRCLPYGDGITYWPVREAVLSALDEDGTDTRAQLAALAGGTQGEVVAERILQLVGLEDGSVAAEEGHWAVRKLLESLSRERPLVLLLDDVQWAELALLDLVEHVADWSRDAPILLACLSRPELLEGRPGWGGGKLNALSLLLSPLDATASEALVDSLLDGCVPASVRERVAGAAEGNPLYVEELLRMLVDEGAIQRVDGAWKVDPDAGELAVPPTIQSLLAARIDGLPADERAALARAAVEGTVFHLAAVVDLGEDADLPQQLGALVRKELIRPERHDTDGEERYAFHHQLVRDAAYDALPKSERAVLHERFADWLERERSTRADVDEIAGHHLERAHRYRVELAPADEHAERLAARAARLLQAAGKRAYGRGDLRAARALLGRGARLDESETDEHVELVEMLAIALVWTGEIAAGIDLLQAALDRTTAGGDRLGTVRVRVALVEAYWLVSPEQALEEIEWLETEALPFLEEVGDHGLLARALRALFQRDWGQCHGAKAAAMAELAASHAREAGDRVLERDSVGWVFTAMFFGPEAAESGIAYCDAALAKATDEYIPAEALNARAGLLALQGRFEEARADQHRCVAIFDDLGLSVMSAVVSSHVGGTVELMAGDLDAAETVMRRGLEQLRGFGERSHLSTTAAQLAEVVYRLGRLDEADELTREAEVASSPDDAMTHAYWRQVRAKVAARRGELDRAERLAREAVALMEPTDFLAAQGHAFHDLAEVLMACGERAEAADCLQKAIEVYERKGDVVDAARMRELLVGAGATPS